MCIVKKRNVLVESFRNLKSAFSVAEAVAFNASIYNAIAAARKDAIRSGPFQAAIIRIVLAKK